ncbi:MAG: porin [Rhodoferax sp.]|uniref:porin n=1 Tax=Rhodoferax sp. TaxID=50421 RepID=UPI0027321389|nr:porin [Rhodoferax sp.]MDP1528306.1 porin [Rhodoferax sp.]MDP1945576.1 porin [Rhodoferax sp.]
MKKSLIALAVLAASGAAMAQSSVTLYGVADIWFGQLDTGATKTTRLDSGGLAGSRWGMKGSEDLGGGLKANFKLEAGYKLDDGTATAGFSRVAQVGFSGGFGEVQVGKPWTALDDVLGAANSGFDSALSATNAVWVTPDNYISNPGNTIKYITPEMGGFSAAVSYSLDEVSATKADTTDFNVAYAGGPITAAFAYQIAKNAGSLDTKFTTLNGSYDLGAAKLLASYANAKNLGGATNKTKEYQLGVDVPLSAAITLSAGYAQSKTDGGEKRTGYGIAAGYSLSKRTTMYAGIRDMEGKTSGVVTSEQSLYAVGVNHKF